VVRARKPQEPATWRPVPRRAYARRSRAQQLLARSIVLRRVLSLIAFAVLIALAVMLLVRVYRHHQAAEPYERDEPISVRLDVSRPAFVKIANGLS
jgi:hypothetical protein